MAIRDMLPPEFDPKRPHDFVPLRTRGEQS